jgi:beta-xylosidase
MATYDIPREFALEDYPFELRNEVGRYLNTHFGKHTIPQISKALQADENKVAWVLTNLCELTSPEVIVDSVKGQQYWENAYRLKSKSPKSFSDQTQFLGRTMRQS